MSIIKIRYPWEQPAIVVRSLIERHPGHASQKVHGFRFGVGAGTGVDTATARRVAKNLKGDKGTQQEYLKRVRERHKSGDVSRMSKSEMNLAFTNAKTPEDRRKFAEAIVKIAGFADYKPAKSADEIPQTDELWARPRDTAKGKLAVFKEQQGFYGVGPVIRNANGKYLTGTNGLVREVQPEFVK